MSALEVSHGRGGAGNINPDDTKYVDGEVTRTGDVGSHGDGPFSSGRGGAANIGDTGSKSTGLRADKDVVPAEAIRPSQDGDYHVGRGGAGNAHSSEKTAGAPPKGLADKLKSRIMGIFKK